MFPLYVLACFLLVSIAIVLIVFPDCRERVVEKLCLALACGWAPFPRAVRSGIRGLLLSGNGLTRAVANVGRFLSVNRWLAGGALVLVVAPSVLVGVMHKQTVFDFSDDLPFADRQIEVLLRGEQLVPPPPLPPGVFTTYEVEAVRPDVATASRNWDLLDHEFTQRLLLAYKLMKERHGYEMVLIEGYRSPERQDQLFAKGSSVTQVGAGLSYHQHGLAADSAFMRDGKVVISERDPWAMKGYVLFGPVAEQVGLVWGGRWKMMDYGHVELQRKGVLVR